MRDTIIKKLQDLADEKYRQFHSNLCPGVENILGVRVPALRKLAKEICKGDWRSFLCEVQNAYYEETMLEGLVIAEAKMELSERLQLLRNFVPKIDNWAVNDVVCASFKLKTSEDLTMVWDFLLQYRNSPHEYERRFMIVMMMDYYLTDKYVDKVLEIVAKIKTEQYYVNMANAWLIATAFAKERERTLKVIQSGVLTDWVQNKAIQKIRESYRVSKSDKEMLLQYKK